MEEKERLTAADVIGPDGHIYPDFSFAGIPGGIPKPPVRIRLKDMGAQPGSDISKMLEDAAKKVAAAGGGAVLIDEGEYYLDEPVMIFDSNVTIIGTGSTKTRLLFRYQVPVGEIRFFRLKPGQDVAATGDRVSP